MELLQMVSIPKVIIGCLTDLVKGYGAAKMSKQWGSNERAREAANKRDPDGGSGIRKSGKSQVSNTSHIGKHRIGTTMWGGKTVDGRAVKTSLWDGSLRFKDNGKKVT